MTAYYNDTDLYVAEWLNNLIAEGLIPYGHVDTRSIVDVQATELEDYTQVHLFAGLGGWSLACRIAGWPDERPIWTGSCPCQPYSNAGRRKGNADERNLWPDMRRLVKGCRPAVVVGEQVASKAGRIWLSGVRVDLEAMAYASRSADACSAGVGAPHIRQRLWWLADTDGGIASYGYVQRSGQYGQQPQDSGAGRLGNSSQPRLEGSNARALGRQRTAIERTGPILDAWSDYCVVQCSDGKTRRFEPGSFPLAHGISNRVGRLRAYGNAINPWLAAEWLATYLDGE